MNINSNYLENDEDNFEWLQKYSTCFVMDSSDIEVLSNPTEFYSFLKVVYFIGLKILTILLNSFVDFKEKIIMFQEKNSYFIALHWYWKP